MTLRSLRKRHQARMRPSRVVPVRAGKAVVLMVNWRAARLMRRVGLLTCGWVLA